MPSPKTTLWESEFSEIGDLPLWNANVIPWMKERGDEYKRVAHSEAKRRGYVFDKSKMEYECPPKFKMFATRGVNLIAVGWEEGVLRCAFAGKDGAKFWQYAGVPEAECEKLKRSPFPDKLFSTNVRNKFKGQSE